MKDALFLKLSNEQAWFRPVTPVDDVETATEDHLASENVTAFYYSKGQDAEGYTGTFDELKGWVESVRGDFFDLPVVVLLSGVNLVSMQVNIPSKQAKHISQALPFMLEDMVAEDIESLHIATGERQKSGDLPVMICQKLVVERLIAAFDDAEINLTHVIADIACVPSDEESWHFLTDGRSMIVRIGEQEALTIELDALPVLLNSLFADEQAEPKSIKVTISSDFTSDNLENWLKTQFTSHLADVDVDFDIEHIQQTSFSYLCDHLIEQLSGGVMNVLQGDFKPTTQKRPSLVKWKPMAALASVFVVFFIGFQYTNAWKLNEKTAMVDEQTKQLYKRYFPQDRNVTDIKRRMKKKLEAAQSQGTGEGFLILLAMVGEKLNEMNRGRGEPRLSPMRITFDQAQGDLKIDFIAAGYSELDTLKAKLEELSLAVEIARATQDGDRMKARMNIRSAG